MVAPPRAVREGEAALSSEKQAPRAEATPGVHDSTSQAQGIWAYLGKPTDILQLCHSKRRYVGETMSILPFHILERRFAQLWIWGDTS